MESTTGQRALVERELAIDASPETVWQFFVDPEKVARWKGMRVEAYHARPGGEYRIEIIPGHVASGKFVELDPPRRLVYTWGWEAKPGEPPNAVPPGSSTIEVELEPSAGGTLVRFVHRDLPSDDSAGSHAHGWDHYLPRLAVAAAGGDPGRDPWLDGPM